MWLLVREGSTERNLHELLPLVKRLRPSRCAFCSDDITPSHLLHTGHLDAVLRQVVAAGLDPVQAIQMSTSNAAQCFGLRRHGAIAPGFVADFLIVDDLRRFTPLQVFKRGQLVARDGRLVVPLAAPSLAASTGTMRPPPLTPAFVPHTRHAGQHQVIGIILDRSLPSISS